MDAKKLTGATNAFHCATSTLLSLFGIRQNYLLLDPRRGHYLSPMTILATGNLVVSYTYIKFSKKSELMSVLLRA